MHSRPGTSPSIALAISLLVGMGMAILPMQRAWADFTGLVVTVFDGDTVVVRTAGRKIRVRLDQIDAPEHDQAWGERSRQALAELVLNRTVRIVTSGTDDYGRTLGHLYLAAGTDVDAEMVRTGNAWAYRQYLRDKTLLELEDEARQAQRGLWSQPGPVPPWQYRHADRSYRPRTRPIEADTGCGSKRYCRQMDNCQEALRYLKCGVTSLDGDGDGVPCETLCRANE